MATQVYRSSDASVDIQADVVLDALEIEAMKKVMFEKARANGDGDAEELKRSYMVYKDGVDHRIEKLFWFQNGVKGFLERVKDVKEKDMSPEDKDLLARLGQILIAQADRERVE
ncbi:uncharacterized protein AB675_3519 [Cyphellophora attinorum]|uniref:Uncharacterized protein n=1 Tax=Cyphellophora attinorum TaxID=1664694 RepID=A0A0N1HT29_9EURO|nr:uncharacterized protein AB675_3519 [Phialophora attinorum]KPI39560.1 hypothetical protein AB675_3519 [Phialophora attinorum]